MIILEEKRKKELERIKVRKKTRNDPKNELASFVRLLQGQPKRRVRSSISKIVTVVKITTWGENDGTEERESQHKQGYHSAHMQAYMVKN